MDISWGELWVFYTLWFAIVLLLIATMWIIFQKADKPGWAALVPFYNLWVMCEVSGKPGWWMFLLWIPFVNIVIAFILLVGLAENFGRGVGFAIGSFFLPFIFFPILAFSDDQYVGP